MALVTHPDVDKVAFTGSTEIGKRIAKGVAGTDKALTLELGGKAANIVFDDAPLDQAVEGIVNGIYFNQGEVCCAGSRLLAQESIVEPLIDKLKDRLSTIRVGDPLDKNTDVGAINSQEPAREDHRARRVRRGRGRRDVPARLRPARPRLLLPPDAVHERRPEPPHRARGDLRAGAVGADLPDPGRGGREGQQHGLRPVGRDLDRQGLAHPRDGRSGCAPASCGPTRSTGSTRPRRSVATRNRASGARAACTACTPTSGSRTADGDARPQAVDAGATTATARAAATRAQNTAVAASSARVEVRKTYKLYIGGAFPRTEIGPLVRRRRRRRHAPRQRLPGVAQGRPRRGPGRARGLPGLGRQDRDEPRPGPLPRRRADGGPARAVRAPRSRPPRGCVRPPPAPSSTGPSTAGSGTPAGPTRSARSSARPTRSRRRTSTSRSRSRPASSASSRPRRRRCSASSAGSRRRSSRATRSC